MCTQVHLLRTSYFLNNISFRLCFLTMCVCVCVQTEVYNTPELWQMVGKKKKKNFTRTRSRNRHFQAACNGCSRLAARFIFFFFDLGHQVQQLKGTLDNLQLVEAKEIRYFVHFCLNTGLVNNERQSHSPTRLVVWLLNFVFNQILIAISLTFFAWNVWLIWF